MTNLAPGILYSVDLKEPLTNYFSIALVFANIWGKISGFQFLSALLTEPSTKWGDRSFPIWNSLPKNIRDCTDLNWFHSVMLPPVQNCFWSLMFLISLLSIYLFIYFLRFLICSLLAFLTHCVPLCSNIILCYIKNCVAKLLDYRGIVSLFHCDKLFAAAGNQVTYIIHGIILNFS